MKRLMALMLVATAAHADLYRWVDPQSGSVKFSNVAPPASQAGVEVVPDRGAAGAKPGAADIGALESRWRELLAAISQSTKLATPDPAMEERLRNFAATGLELDRLDPAGAARRRAEAQATLQRLVRGTR